MVKSYLLRFQLYSISCYFFSSNSRWNYKETISPLSTGSLLNDTEDLNYCLVWGEGEGKKQLNCSGAVLKQVKYILKHEEQ